MSTSPVGISSNSYVQQALLSALQSASTSNAATPPSSDSSQLSPFAQLASTLQQLEQSDPAKYKQVTEQVATNLQSAAQTAQSDGNTSAAGQLTQLATDFTNASQTGQLPNLQDLAQAVGGGGGHHHHHHAEAASSDSSSAAATPSGSSSSQTLSQLLASLFQSAGSQSTSSASLDPGTIILQTLTQAGVSATNT
jgi:hypothetical protein